MKQRVKNNSLPLRWPSPTGRWLVLTLALALVTLQGCRSRGQLVGDWVLDVEAPVPQGVQLAKGGLAASLGTPEVQYSSWSMMRGRLVLNGKRFENHTVQPFSDTLTIERLNKAVLILSHDRERITYHRL